MVVLSACMAIETNGCCVEHVTLVMFRGATAAPYGMGGSLCGVPEGECSDPVEHVAVLGHVSAVSDLNDCDMC